MQLKEVVHFSIDESTRNKWSANFDKLLKEILEELGVKK